MIAEGVHSHLMPAIINSRDGHSEYKRKEEMRLVINVITTTNKLQDKGDCFWEEMTCNNPGIKFRVEF